MINIWSSFPPAIGLNSCLQQLQSGSMPIVSLTSRGFPNGIPQKKNELYCGWKRFTLTGSKADWHFVAATMATEKTLQLLKEGEQVQEQKEGEGKEIDSTEAVRRMKISRANKGKAPWNIGRKHSPETIARIKERTKQAMQNPKIRQKLSQAQFSRSALQSEEEKDKIRAVLRTVWKVRQQRLLLQQSCIIEWKEIIAESARRGDDGKDELHWDNYNTLRKEMHHQRLHAVKKSKGSGVAKSAEQRRKISEAIKAKWADPDYRENVLHAKLKKRTAMKEIESEKPSKPRRQMLTENSVAIEPKDARMSSRPKNMLVPSYSDPQAETKLQIIKQIRANREAIELNKRKATERARSLIAEAEKAAKALEATAIDSALVQAFLSDIHRLLNEAINSMKTVESVKSARSPISTYTDTVQSNYFMDRSQVADPAIPDSGDNNGVDQPSLTNSRQSNKDTLIAFTWDMPLNREISRSLYYHSVYPKFGSSEVIGAVNSSKGSVIEGIRDEINEEDALVSVESTVGKNTILADEQESSNQKGESMLTENIRKDITSSIVHPVNFSLPGGECLVHTAGDFEATPFQMVKDGALTTKKKKKKWIRGRLTEVKED